MTCVSSLQSAFSRVISPSAKAARMSARLVMLFLDANRPPLRLKTLYSALALIQPATALPIACPESSWIKCEPGTVISARRGLSRGTISMRSGNAIRPKDNASHARVEGRKYLSSPDVTADSKSAQFVGAET